MQIGTAIPAATILLLRDGPAGLEVLMVRRHGKSGFAAGALVFPGGKVDAADAELARFAPPGELLPSRIAAIRETWEEAGIFLARRKGTGRLLSGEDILRYRASVPDMSAGLAALLAREALELATDGLAHFAHWITPAEEPRRFDTQFFLAAAPPDQIAAADGHETLDCAWLTPAAALAEADAGRALLMFPTRLNLMKLASSASVPEALDRAAREPVVTVRPVIRTEAGRRIVRISGDLGYALTEMSIGKA